VKPTVATEIEVELVQAWPDRCESRRLRLPDGATVAEALERAREQGFAAAATAAPGMLAVFGRLVAPATRLRDGDRIELLRPLQADPKERRRERAGRSR
jgi:putative ubiquitin-RnfH superfamily antitoxin RatB of RatAB toxin-antitoxin module